MDDLFFPVAVGFSYKRINLSSLPSSSKVNVTYASLDGSVINIFYRIFRSLLRPGSHYSS